MAFLAQDTMVAPWTNWFCVLVGAGILFVLFAIALGGIIWLIVSKSCGPKDAPHLDAAYAFINFMQDPYVQAREASVHGYAPTDSRAIALQPDSLSSDPILHPAAELMNGLEFGAAQTLTDPIRAELMARFKSC